VSVKKQKVSKSSTYTWSFNCSWSGALLEGGIKMPTFVDKEVQARLLREIQELYEKRGKIEADIRALEAKAKLQIEKAALQEIDAYKNLNRTRAQPS
jgi:hypothetical protein